MIVDYTTYNSPNFSNRHKAIDSIILHHTGGSFPGCAMWLCHPNSGVSAHYLIIRRGRKIFQLVPDHEKAWHAGKSCYDLDGDGVITDVEKLWNDRSIGIEIEAFSPYYYHPNQINALDELVVSLCMKHMIAPVNILGHKEIAKGRKIDPENFDMNLYRQKIAMKLSRDDIEET
jgi:N-acetylmuramoyl-L-alanine amidase